jgi:hypothetical protein
MTTTYADGTTNTEYSNGSIITYPMVLPLRQGVFAQTSKLSFSA